MPTGYVILLSVVLGLAAWIIVAHLLWRRRTLGRLLRGSRVTQTAKGLLSAPRPDRDLPCF